MCLLDAPVCLRGNHCPNDAKELGSANAIVSWFYFSHEDLECQLCSLNMSMLTQSHDVCRRHEVFSKLYIEFIGLKFHVLLFDCGYPLLIQSLAIPLMRLLK